MEDRGVSKIDTPSGTQDITIIVDNRLPCDHEYSESKNSTMNEGNEHAVSPGCTLFKKM